MVPALFKIRLTFWLEMCWLFDLIEQVVLYLPLARPARLTRVWVWLRRCSWWMTFCRIKRSSAWRRLNDWKPFCLRLLPPVPLRWPITSPATSVCAPATAISSPLRLRLSGRRAAAKLCRPVISSSPKSISRRKVTAHSRRRASHLRPRRGPHLEPKGKKNGFCFVLFVMRPLVSLTVICPDKGLILLLLFNCFLKTIQFL